MSEEKKIKRGNKITSFDIRTEEIIDPEMDEVLREELMREADELEAKLNSDPKLVGAGVSDDLFLSIVGKLKEQGVWEEDEEELVSAEAEEEDEAEMSSEEIEAEEKETKAEEKFEKETAEEVKEETLEKLYEMLPEEDRKALEIGRKVQEQGEKKARKKKKRRKVYRYAGVAAAMLVLVCGVGMSTEANRKVALQAWNAVMESFGFRTYTDSVDDTLLARSKSEEEITAYEEVSEKLGIAGVDFVYMPEGMKYLGFEIDSDLWESIMFYSYNDSIISITVINTEKEGVSYYSLDNYAEKVSEVINQQNIKSEIWNTNANLFDEEGGQTYIGKAEYNNCRLVINGKLPITEIEKIMEKIFFL